MSILSQLALQTGSAIINGNPEAFGLNYDKKQLDQQQKLQDLQIKGNKQMMDYSSDIQRKMWEYTNFGNQRKQMESAGLNPALMYQQAGAGVTGTATGNVNSGNASDASSRKMADIQSQGMALQLAKLASEIDVNKSVAEVNRASAGLSGEKSETEEQQRNFLIGKLREEGVYYWLQNELNEIKLSGTGDSVEVIKNKFLDRVIGKSDNSWAQQEITNALLKTVAETGKLEADKILSNERAKAIWKELLIAQQNADNDTIRAKANELAVNWGTGEYKNWKTWADLGANALKTITSIIK